MCHNQSAFIQPLWHWGVFKSSFANGWPEENWETAGRWIVVQAVLSYGQGVVPCVIMTHKKAVYIGYEELLMVLPSSSLRRLNWDKLINTVLSFMFRKI